MQKVHKCMGYCPQFDALIDELTANEQLTLYARLRGVPENEVQTVSSNILWVLLSTFELINPSLTITSCMWFLLFLSVVITTGCKRKLSNSTFMLFCVSKFCIFLLILNLKRFGPLAPLFFFSVFFFCFHVPLASSPEQKK